MVEDDSAQRDPQQVAKGLRIATRCETADQFIATYHQICEDGAIFIPNTQRALGTVLQFRFDLRDGNPALLGVGTVIDVLTSPTNRFGCAGILIELQRLSRTTAVRFEQMRAARAPHAPGTEPDAPPPKPSYPRAMTVPVAVIEAAKVEPVTRDPVLRRVPIPPPTSTAAAPARARSTTRTRTVIGLPVITAKKPMDTVKIPAVIGPPQRRILAKPVDPPKAREAPPANNQPANAKTTRTAAPPTAAKTPLSQATPVAAIGSPVAGASAVPKSIDDGWDSIAVSMPDELAAASRAAATRSTLDAPEALNIEVAAPVAAAPAIEVPRTVAPAVEQAALPRVDVSVPPAVDAMPPVEPPVGAAVDEAGVTANPDDLDDGVPILDDSFGMSGGTFTTVDDVELSGSPLDRDLVALLVDRPGEGAPDVFARVNGVVQPEVFETSTVVASPHALERASLDAVTAVERRNAPPIAAPMFAPSTYDPPAAYEPGGFETITAVEDVELYESAGFEAVTAVAQPDVYLLARARPEDRAAPVPWSPAAPVVAASAPVMLEDFDVMMADVPQVRRRPWRWIAAGAAFAGLLVVIAATVLVDEPAASGRARSAAPREVPTLPVATVPAPPVVSGPTEPTPQPSPQAHAKTDPRVRTKEPAIQRPPARPRPTPRPILRPVPRKKKCSSLDCL